MTTLHRSEKMWRLTRNGTCFLAAGVLLLIAGGCAMGLRRPPDAGQAGRVVSAAKSLLGVPYRYGGSTPRGFDCSGLVQYVFKQSVGLKLPRTSRHQFDRTRPVQRGHEKPSDLLFFDINGRGISHVGIYLGRGKFIHAPNNGDKVKVSNANTKYWRRRFRGVRRALP